MRPKALDGKCFQFFFFLAVSLVFQFVALHGFHHLNYDTAEYVEMAALLNGTGPRFVRMPFRVVVPWYSYEILAVHSFVGNWVTAAKIASWLPSVAIAPLIALIAREIDDRPVVGLLAGLIASCWTQLTELGLHALSDSSFVFYAGLALWLSLRYLRTGELISGVAASVSAGLATATRSQGSFHALGMLLVVIWAVKTGRTSGRLRHGLVLVPAYLLAAGMPTWFLMSHVRELAPPPSYNKILLIDAIRNEGSDRAADEIMWRVNPLCWLQSDAVNEKWSLPSWPVLIKRWGRPLVKAMLLNLYRNHQSIIPLVVFGPVLASFMPLAIGILRSRDIQSAPARVLLALTVAPYLAIVPLLQVASRLVSPLCLVSLPLIGVGLATMITSVPVSGNRRITRLLGAFFLLVLLANGAKNVLSSASSPDNETAYSQAIDWVLRRGLRPGEHVLSTRPALVAYLPDRIALWHPMPEDEVLPFCKRLKVRYVIIAHQSRHEDIERIPVSLAASFGTRDNCVDVLELMNGQTF